MSAETQMFRTNAAEAREAEIVQNALDDRQTVAFFYGIAKTMRDRLFENRVTLCDNGTAEDFDAIIEAFRPHDTLSVVASARRVAAQLEAEMDE